MSGSVLQSVWPILVALAYLLVTCILFTLAMARRHEIDVHDRVRESKALRGAYLEACRKRQSQNRN